MTARALPLLISAAALSLNAAAGEPVTPESSGTEIAAAIRAAYRSAKSPEPALDPILGAAAQALARRALEVGARAATDGEAVAAELSRAGGWDPPPRAIVVRASPPAHAARALGARADLATAPATHVGIGVAIRDDLAAVVVLFVQRRATLEPFPRTVGVGDTRTLSGQLAFPLHDARVFVTSPSGVGQTSASGASARDRFSVPIAFDEAGAYTVEVVAESVKGPEVAALLRVQAGAASERKPEATEIPELDDRAKAESQVLAAINRRRSAAGRAPLARSALLDSVAAEHCAEMVRMGYFAHVSPVSGDPGERVAKAGFRYRRVAENLGEASSALEAHRLIESSPGHLANVLDPEVDLVGIGTARVQRGGIENVLVTELFARAAP